MISSRRSFLVGLGAALVTAPAIVRVSSIMPVKAMKPLDLDEMVALLQARLAAAENELSRQLAQSLYGDGTGVAGGINMMAAELSQKPHWELRQIESGIVVKDAPYFRTSPRFTSDKHGLRWKLA